MWYRFVLAGRKDIEQRFGKDAYEIIKSIQTNLQEPAAAFVHYVLKTNPELITRNLIPVETFKQTFDAAKDLVNRNKLQIKLQKNQVIIKTQKEEFQYDLKDFLQFAEKIDFFHALLFPGNEQAQAQTEEDLNIPENQIIVKKANNVSDAINFGRGTTWCISQPKNTMYQSYRLQKESTFYFIFDTTRPEGDPLRRVVVDMSRNGVLLTDLNNDTGTISEFKGDDDAYFEYLENNGVDLNQFKNEPYSDQEKLEYEFISYPRYDLQSFKNLNIEARNKNINDIYSKYIGFGHTLTKEQFEFLNDNNAQTLINQYLNTGNALDKSTLNLLNNQQMKTYLRARKIMFDHYVEEHTDYGEFQIHSFMNDMKDHFDDELFVHWILENQLQHDPVFLIHKLSWWHYQTGKYKELINQLFNQVEPRDKQRVTYSLLRSHSAEILDDWLRKYPEEINYVEEELGEFNSFREDSMLLTYLYGKVKKPELFINDAILKLLDQNYGLPAQLIEDGYANILMEKLLTYNYDVTPQIDFLLQNGASLEKAWNIASTQYGVKIVNQLHIYKLMKEKHHNYMEEWMAEENPTLRKKFDPEMAEKYINKFEPQMPVSDEPPDLSKETQSFNLNKYLMKSGKYYVV